VIRILLLLAGALSLQAQPYTKTWTALSATGVTANLAVSGSDVHTLSVVVTGSPGSCTLNLDGSADGTHWFDISKDSNGADQTCTSSFMFHVVNKAVMFVRVNVTALSAGGTVTPSYVGHSSGGR